MYWSVVWCSGGCSWKCYKTLMFCPLLRRCTIPCACHVKRHMNLQKWSEPLVFLTFWLRNVLRATTACTFSTSEPPKAVREWCALYILTSKVLRVTTACTFSTSQLPKAVRNWGVLYMLTSKCASRHNGVQFFISHLASWLRTRRFSEATFRPSGATNHWKNTVFRNFPTFSRICIFFLLTLSLLRFSLLIFLFSLPLPYSAFHLSILSEVWLLNFLRIVGQRTSRICSCAEIIKKCTSSLLGAWISPHLGVCICVCVCVCCPRIEKFVQRQDDDLFPFSVCKVTLVRLAVGARKLENTTSKHYTTSYNHNHIYIYHYYHCLTSTVTARSPDRSKPGFLTSTKSSLREANAQPAQEHEPQKLADRLKLLWKDDAWRCQKGCKSMQKYYFKNFPNWEERHWCESSPSLNDPAFSLSLASTDHRYNPEPQFLHGICLRWNTLECKRCTCVYVFLILDVIAVFCHYAVWYT